MVHVALILSGCGYLDGSEIHESVLAWTALDRAQVSVTIAAPTIEFDPADHAGGSDRGARRNSFSEAARIARGRLVALSSCKAEDFDLLVMPGGYGAARLLSDFETAGGRCKVHPELARLVLAMLRAKKPIGAICIAPAIVAAVMRDNGWSARMTLGNDPDLAQTLREMGQEGVVCPVDQCIVDAKHRIVTTPAYMYDARIADVARGIERLVAALVSLATPQPVSS